MREPDCFSQLMLVSHVGVPVRLAQRGGEVPRALRPAACGTRACSPTTRFG